MPAQIRLGVDSSMGIHAPGTPPSQASRTNYTNGIASVRVGDAYVPHGHPRAAVGGHRATFINYRMAHRFGDGISCGDRANGGSRNSFVGVSLGG